MKLIDINYSVSNTSDLGAVIQMYKTSFGYLQYLNKFLDTEVILHLSVADSITVDRVSYKGLLATSGFFHIPFNSHRYIKSLKPDVVLVQGLVFPIQILALRLTLGRKVKIIAQHHGGVPFTNGIKKHFLRLADRCINAYLFTAKGNADIWIDNGVISSKDKCYEVLEASTYLSKQDRKLSRTKLHVTEEEVMFLWVGRLNANKDPITVLRGFEKQFEGKQGIRLYMVFQDDHMLTDVKQLINNSNMLKGCVMLVGKVNNDELKYWYSAANFFVSGSHYEGSGYALIECMACGCIPIVTDIPPFRNITKNGQLALLFQPGDVDSLTNALQQSENINRLAMSEEILDYFSSHLSFKAIAGSINKICQTLTAK